MLFALLSINEKFPMNPPIHQRQVTGFATKCSYVTLFPAVACAPVSLRTKMTLIYIEIQIYHKQKSHILGVLFRNM